MSLLKEALRVLKKGGHFSFQGLFTKKFYVNPDNLEGVLKSWGLENVHFVRSSDHIAMPLSPRMNPVLVMGSSGILYGKKQNHAQQLNASDRQGGRKLGPVQI